MFACTDSSCHMSYGTTSFYAVPLFKSPQIHNMRRIIVKKARLFSVILIVIMICSQGVVLAYDGDKYNTITDKKVIGFTEFGWVTFNYKIEYHECYNIGSGTTTYVHRMISQNTTCSNSAVPAKAGFDPAWVHHANSSSSRMFVMYPQSAWEPDDFSHQYCTNDESVTYAKGTDLVGNTCYSIEGQSIPFSVVIKVPLNRM